MPAKKSQSTLKDVAADNAVYLMLNTTRHIKRAIHRRLAEQYTSKQPIYVGLFPHIDFDGTQITELARRMHCSKQLASRMALEAERNGMVEIIADQDDKRAKKVCFTPEGTQRLEETFAIYDEIETELSAEMSDKDFQALKTLLKKLNSTLRKSG